MNTKKNPQVKNEVPVQSEVPFKTDDTKQPSIENQVNKLKTNTMNSKKNPVKAAAPAKKSVPSKPAPRSIKRAAAEKAKLSIVKGATTTAGDKSEKPVDQSVKQLQQTLRVVNDLSRKIEQRSNIIDTLDSIQEFKFTQEAKEGEYNGCSITFTDDSRKTWVIKDLRVIQHLADVAIEMCRKKLEDLEKTIYLPKNAA